MRDVFLTHTFYFYIIRFEYQIVSFDLLVWDYFLDRGRLMAGRSKEKIFKRVPPGGGFFDGKYWVGWSETCQALLPAGKPASRVGMTRVCGRARGTAPTGRHGRRIRSGMTR